MSALVAGDAIKRARLDAGLTQAQLAARLNASPPYISNLENGRANVTVGQLWAIASALDYELHLELRAPRALELPAIPPPPSSSQPH